MKVRRSFSRATAVAAERGAENSQSFSEFALRRSDLFAGKAGGLHPVRADQQAYLALQFVTGGEDPFEPSALREIVAVRDDLDRY